MKAAVLASLAAAGVLAVPSGTNPGVLRLQHKVMQLQTQVFNLRCEVLNLEYRVDALEGHPVQIPAKPQPGAWWNSCPPTPH